MKQHHDEEEPEKENSERWLLTYSDLITLLLALFIILYAMSSIDLAKMKELAQGFNEVFPNSSSSASAGGGGSNAAGASSSSSGGDSSSASGAGEKEPDPLAMIYNELASYIKSNGLEDKIGLENADGYVKVSLRDVVLFAPDKAVIIQESAPILEEINGVLGSVYGDIDHITISGHTADADKDEQISSAFAWKLSTDRAVTVLNYLSNLGLPEYKLSIQGRSHFEPVADNNTAEGRAQNRRVEILITKAGKSSSDAESTDPATAETMATTVESSETSGTQAAH